MIPLHEILFGTKQETLAGDHIQIDINTEKKNKTKKTQPCKIQGKHNNESLIQTFP